MKKYLVSAIVSDTTAYRQHYLSIDIEIPDEATFTDKNQVSEVFFPQLKNVIEKEIGINGHMFQVTILAFSRYES